MRGRDLKVGMEVAYQRGKHDIARRAVVLGGVGDWVTQRSWVRGRTFSHRPGQGDKRLVLVAIEQRGLYGIYSYDKFGWKYAVVQTRDLPRSWAEQKKPEAVRAKLAADRKAEEKAMQRRVNIAEQKLRDALGDQTAVVRNVKGARARKAGPQVMLYLDDLEKLLAVANV